MDSPAGPPGMSIFAQIILSLLQVAMGLFEFGIVQDDAECMVRINGGPPFLNLVSPVLLIRPAVLEPLAQAVCLIVILAAGGALGREVRDTEAYFRAVFRWYVLPIVVPFGILAIGWWAVTLGWLYSLVIFAVPILGLNVLPVPAYLLCCGNCGTIGILYFLGFQGESQMMHLVSHACILSWSVV